MKKLLALCVLVLSALPGLPVAAQSNAQIRIVYPLDREIVPVGTVTVTVATQNLALGTDYHWHLYLDGQLLDMVGNGATSWPMEITTSGPHDIKAALADAQHDELSSATIQVTAAPATPRTLPWNLALVAPVMGALAVAILALILIGLRITRRPVE